MNQEYIKYISVYLSTLISYILTYMKHLDSLSLVMALIKYLTTTELIDILDIYSK